MSDAPPACGPLSPPILRIWNRQRKIRFQVGMVRPAVLRAVPGCLAAARPGSPLLSLRAIEATVVSDRRIAAAHGRFFSDPTPTDVITFDTGDILLGAETIATNAREYGHSVERELTLCIIHGLLHLGGYRDKSSAEADKMSLLQHSLLEEVMPTAQSA